MTRQVDVVVVGSVNRDYVCRVDDLPTSGQTVLGGQASVGSGGKGGNQAVAASLLGARTAIVARVGRDDDGRAVAKDLAEAWVDTTEMVATGTRTGLAFVMVDERGENSIVVAPGANDLLEARTTARAVRSMLAPSGVVVTQAEIPEPAFDAAVRAAGDVGARAVVNLAPYRPIAADLLALCDPLVVNESEASGLLGRQVRGVDQARDAVAELAGRCRSVIVTVGAAGAVVGRRAEIDVVAAEAVAVVDTTGAGDAFTGALAAALGAGCELVEAARIGVRAGTYAVCRPGAQASFPRAAEIGVPPLYRRG
ncbi:ribokinase [Nocardioides sp. YIM 152315]|uniref:ribokinase n=1 Tax=Nocardioides sp. YIM 152315 TaxID=3031760 RepID=UPI0023DC8150|nr:ribokinase [Nocardioides sp. YIM 152315]MDF1605406.1 ribokinase [Nocardioides sp. YIM 152315]